MKKILGLFLLIGGTVAVSSCDEDLLEPYYPGAQTSDVAINSSDDLVALMNSAYAMLTPTAEIAFNSLFTDEATKGYANGGQGSTDFFPFLMNSSDGSANNIWATHYFSMAYANRVIKFSENIEAEDAADQVVIDRAVAEALTLRAYCHNQLLAYYSTNPKDPAALGVILSVDVYPSNYRASRATNAEVYTQIDADLTQALALFPAGDAHNPSRANINFAKATWARSYAQRGDYPNAMLWADNVIANSGISMAPFADYLKVFHTDSNTASTEVIFKLEKLNGETKTGSIWASTAPTVVGSPFYEIGRGLFNELNNAVKPGNTTYTVTAVTGPNLTIPGHSLSVNDMVVALESRPVTAAPNTNGVTTTPASSLLAGKVYWVRTISGDNITLTNEAFGAANVNFAGAANGFVPVNIVANDGDIRYSAIVAPTSIIHPNYMDLSTGDYLTSDKLIFRKYPGTTSTGTFTNDIKISRITEMYMIRAEAQVAAGDLTAAAATIKQIRDRRFNKPQDQPVYADATAAWKDILTERRKEFAAEGYRFLDLKRLGALANETIQRDPKDCELVDGNCSLPLGDYRWALPIPQVESNANPGILSQQNPGY